MSRDPKYDVLFEPVPLGPKIAPNRFYQTPHCTGFGSTYPGAQAYFRGMKAEGGWGVINTEYCSIHPEADDIPWVAARLWSDADARNLSLMCEKIHEHGGLAGVELHYGGSNATGYQSRLASRGISQIPSDDYWMTSCTEMDKEDIRELEEFYAAAAVRARDAGFDVINVHGREVGPIPVHFLMRHHNKRTDEYGGSLENRARFWLETLELVRGAVGDDCAITAGLTLDTLDGRASGLSIEEEGVGFIELADHLVDFWDVQVGGPTIAEWMVDAAASRIQPENWQQDWHRRIRAHTKKPIIGIGRFTSADTMAQVISSGQLDMIGGARGSIADPFLPRKIEDGRLDDIRECIGCNMCVSRFNQGAPIVCTQNATTGEEYRRGWHPERFERANNAEKDVLVIGAGPAGLECAMVLGKRGMRRIHLVEAEDEIGGIMRWVPTLPALGEWGRLLSYRKIQLAKLPNVEVITGTRLSAQDVLDYGAELVVVATGSRWATDGLSGATHDWIPGADASLPHCLTPEQIMLEGKEVPGDDVLVYDCDGYFVAVGLAEKLAREGKRVHVVTPLPSLAPYLAFTGEARHVAEVLHELGATITTQHVVTSIEPGRVRGQLAWVPETPAEWQADAVVLVTQRKSIDALYRELRQDRDHWQEAGIEGVYRIGDCVAPRMIADAIFDGHRLAREIDTADPSKALPYIVEHRYLGANDEDYDRIVGNGVSSVLKRDSLVSATSA